MRDKSITSFDGTRIHYRVAGRGDRWLVVANGYGGTYSAWDDVFGHLDGYRTLIWDYRGLHRSERPADRDALRIADHCRDLDGIREAEGIGRMVIAAWSVGCQVALEQLRRDPESVAGLVLANGAHGRVVERSSASPRAASALRTTLRAIRAAAPVVGTGLLPPLRLAAAGPWTGPLLRRAGLFNGDSPSLADAARSVLALDYRIYAHMILLADEHDADDLLEAVDVPAAVIGGGRDRITSTALSSSIAARIPRARYHEIPGATHYGLMEFPDRYAAAIDEVFALG